MMELTWFTLDTSRNGRTYHKGVINEEGLYHWRAVESGYAPVINGDG